MPRSPSSFVKGGIAKGAKSAGSSLGGKAALKGAGKLLGRLSPWIFGALLAKDLSDATGLTDSIFGNSDKRAEEYGRYFGGQGAAAGNLAEQQAGGTSKTLNNVERVDEAAARTAGAPDARKEAGLSAVMRRNQDEIASISLGAKPTIEEIAAQLGIEI